MFEVIGQLVFGWILVDFLSGILHWFEDEVAGEDWPIIGPAITVPNRRHHKEPLAFLDSGLLGRNGITWGITCFLGVILVALFGFQLWILAAVAGGLIVNEVHAWAHAPRLAPAWARIIQETGIIQSPKAHSRHHAGEHNSGYCVLTNFLNPIFDYFNVWRRLEKMLSINKI